MVVMDYKNKVAYQFVKHSSKNKKPYNTDNKPLNT